jgi:TM2 domain-containing membrane protein YozV
MIEDPSEPAETRQGSGTEALASAFIPGVGQLLQGRRLAGVAQFTTVIAYLVIGSAVGLRHAMLFALVWNVYSVIDAYRYRGD